MNALAVIAFACLAVFASGKPSGHGVVVSGPSGIVTGHGAVGPAGHGGWGDGSWDGAWGGAHSNVVVGNGATLIGPGVGHAVVAGPVVGHGLLGGAGVWGGHGGWAGAGLGLGHGLVGLGGHGLVGLGGHGVVVKGPATVPATIVGPSGKVHAEGLYGVGHGSWGHHW